MNQTDYAEATLLSAVHPHLSKHTNVFSILISVLVALAGIAAIVWALDLDKSSSTLSMTLLTLGTILLLVALYRMFWRSRETVYLPTGSCITEGSYYLDTCDLNGLSSMLEQGDFNASKGIAFKVSGNARMDYMLSKDHQFVAVQLFRFVPYTYEPASQVYYYTGNEAALFARHLNDKSF